MGFQATRFNGSRIACGRRHRGVKSSVPATSFRAPAPGARPRGDGAGERGQFSYGTWLWIDFCKSLLLKKKPKRPENLHGDYPPSPSACFQGYVRYIPRIMLPSGHFGAGTCRLHASAGPALCGRGAEATVLRRRPFRASQVRARTPACRRLGKSPGTSSRIPGGGAFGKPRGIEEPRAAARLSKKTSGRRRSCRHRLRPAEETTASAEAGSSGCGVRGDVTLASP